MRLRVTSVITDPELVTVCHKCGLGRIAAKNRGLELLGETTDKNRCSLCDRVNHDARVFRPSEVVHRGATSVW